MKETGPLKSKYYPHLTICAAAAMIAGPLCLVVMLSYVRTPLDVESAAVIVDTRLIADPSSEPVVVLHDRHLEDAPFSLPDAASKAATPEAVLPPANDDGGSSSANTRVAMRPQQVESSASLSHDSQTPPAPSTTDTDAVIQMANLDDTKEAPTPVIDQVPVPVSTAIVNNHHAVVPWGTKSVPSAVSVDTAAAVESDLPQTDMVPFSPEGVMSPELEEFPDPVVVESHFDATGHLSLSSGSATAAIAGTLAPAADTQTSAQTTTPAKSDTSVNETKRNTAANSRSVSRANRVAKTKSDAKSKAADEITMATRGTDGRWPEADTEFGATAKPLLEDVILQQPLESRRVQRMENVVALTRAKGWPIALVRSNLPDDHWWVQQMVGIRGNAFAARVNFGNEHSISGSVYHMVFVFLDSPDEVRRFRIAKQFKELPEGIRRTREFTFTRR